MPAVRRQPPRNSAAEPEAFEVLLRQSRLAAGLTQEALAERAGLGVRSIQDLERGVAHPRAETTERLLAALGAGRLAFGAFRNRCADRHEVLVAFLAVLVLVRRRVIEAEQAGPFGEISLRRAAPMTVGCSHPADPFVEVADD